MGKVKYKLGDKLYSWQYPKRKGNVCRIHPQPKGYPAKYKLSYMGTDGYLFQSKWIDEQSLTKRRTKKWIKENM